jgi:protein phosphatase methylesterase 1
MPAIVDDPALAGAVTAARGRFLARQPFDRFDVTVLAQAPDGRWLRGSVGGSVLAYPASTVKLAYLVAAVHWCAERERPPHCLDADVRPMIVESDNVATGRVVDALSGAPNIESGSNAAFERWLAQRRYTERLLASLGLLGAQRVLNKTWPTNSGEEPVGFEKLSIARVGRNALTPDDSARLMLAIEEGVIEPRGIAYMKSLLQRERYGGHGGYGRGLPPGTEFRAKNGLAYDTLQEIAAFRLPDGRRFVIAAFSNGLDKEDPPHDVATLGGFVEELLSGLPSPNGSTLPWSRVVAAANESNAPDGWQRVRRKGARADSGAVYESANMAAEFSWRVPLPMPARYDLAVWYPAADGQATRAAYSAAGAATASLATYDQRRWNARWLPLGTVDAAAGELVVTVRNAGTGRLVADSVRVTALQPAAIAAPRSASSSLSTER